MTRGLGGLLALRGLDRAGALARLGLSEDDLDRGVAYERLGPVDRAHNPAVSACHVYLRADAVAMVYLGDPAREDVTAAALREHAGPEPLRLASRAGPDAVLSVDPAAGLAWSERGGRLDFVEAFPPTTAERYVAEVYAEPQFLR